MYIAAIAGPIELHRILRTTVIPNDTPLNCFGVAFIVISNPPTCVNDIPAAIMARLVAIRNCVE
jgi:hypothetical protein